jgi:signal transduction histidine kinase
MPVSTDKPQTISFLQGGGELGRLMRSKDWSRTPLGNIEKWPQSLRTALGIVLHSKFPMFLFWGPQLTCFYNDAFRPSLGNDGKHPAILGIPAQEAWAEIWHIIKPMIDQVMDGGEGIWSEDQLIPIFRNGSIEKVYWTFSYSPIIDESGKPAGVFVTCMETTSKVQSQAEQKLFIDTIRKAEQQKDDFIKIASHELKTPVTAVKGYTQLLLSKYADSNDVVLSGSLNVIDKQMSKLTKLITDLLDVTKIGAGSFQLNKEKFLISDLISEIATDFQITTSHSIVMEMQAGLYVYADKDRITQVLLNLLANAIKYSPGSNKIIIKTEQSGNDVIISVQDFGMGIAPDDHDKIFERFYRVEGIDEKAYPGFGIGLFIVKEMVALHDGKVWVDSEKGGGSSFHFSLPV